MKGEKWKVKGEGTFGVLAFGVRRLAFGVEVDGVDLVDLVDALLRAVVKTPGVAAVV